MGRGRALALTTLLILALAACARSAPPARGPIVLIVVDTLRADHLPCYGYARPTAPHLCALAGDGVRFARAFTVRTRTTPSIASMLTGLPPHRHGVTELLVELPAGVATIAEEVRAAGWATGGFVSSFVMISELNGFGRGFDVYDDDVRTREAYRENYERAGAETIDRALEWLRGAGPHSFAFIHLIEPHGPYTPPEPFRTQFALPPDDRLPGAVPPYQQQPDLRSVAEYVGRYDGEIAAADAQIGRVVAALRAWGWYADATVLVTADHGESMGEEGLWFEHGRGLSDAEARVPLLIKFAGSRAPRGAVDVPVSTADIAPTVLGAAELGARRPGLAGADLRAVAEGRPRAAAAPITERDDIASATVVVHDPDCAPRWRVPAAALRDGEGLAAAWAAGQVANVTSPTVDPTCAARAAETVRPYLADHAAFRLPEAPRVHVALKDLGRRRQYIEQRSSSALTIDDAGYEALRQLGYAK